MGLVAAKFRRWIEKFLKGPSQTDEKTQGPGNEGGRGGSSWAKTLSKEIDKWFRSPNVWGSQWFVGKIYTVITCWLEKISNAKLYGFRKWAIRIINNWSPRIEWR